MKKTLLLAAWAFIVTLAHSQQPALIPQPVSLVQGKGSFILPSSPVITTDKNEELKKIAKQLAMQLGGATGYKVSIKDNKPPVPKAIALSLVTDPSIPKEGYRLKVTAAGVMLAATSPAGIFYGVQTLLQLLPKEIASTTVQKMSKWEIPVVTIEDYPRFGWRGIMLDVSRHFFTKEQVKEYIDEMVRYKFNLLHWHLTDDEGWRIEIKALPRLTQVGAWNVKRVGYFGTFAAPAADEPRNFGGFYTQEDIKEVVQYAKDRFVDILPEIDVPGHSLAAVVSYPDLSCTPGAENYHVRSGEEIMDWSHGQPPIAMVDNTLCPANEKVYDFMDKVLTEVAPLFPFAYIHLGGDECPKNYWEKSDAIKALMQKEGLKNMEEVQSYFEKRVEKIVASKGKKLIGWDEILEGGLAPSAAVMSWRGMKGGIEAAKQKHEVVMSPTTFAYIDYMQGDASLEPRIYATLRLSKAYQFEPVPEGVDPIYIKGGQCNLWSEQVYNMRHAQYMTWPRAFAIAEVLWSPKEKRNWNDFVPRVEKHFERFDIAQVKYAPSMYDPEVTVTKNEKGELVIKLATEINGLAIHYSFDNSYPDQFYPKYDQPLVVPKEAFALKLITYRNNKPIGRMMVLPVTDLNKRAGKGGDD
jgi:hexosaminidase